MSTEQDELRKKILEACYKHITDHSTENPAESDIQSQHNQSSNSSEDGLRQQIVQSCHTYAEHSENFDSSNNQFQQNIGQILSEKKLHIVINKSQTYYAVLDRNFNVVDTISINFFKRHLLNNSNRRKFKKEIRRDLKSYKNDCKNQNKKPNKDIIRMHKDILYYFDLCKDADCCILELLRRNVTQLNPNFKNYQTACALYLRELARLFDGDPDQLPFDINFATTDNIISSNHKYISNSFLVSSRSNNIVEDFVAAYRKPESERDRYLREHRYTTQKSPNKFKQAYKSEKTVNMQSQSNARNYDR